MFYQLLSAYDVPAINQHLHFIHIMAYDYHGSWDFRNTNSLAYLERVNLYCLIAGTS
jgi:chitinase